MSFSAYCRGLVVIGAVLLTGCASGASAGASAAARPKRCEPSELQPSWVATGPVYRSCEVERVAKATAEVSLRGWNPPPAARRDCYTALIEFVVDTAGIPEASTARLVRATDSQLGSTLLSTIPSRHYFPALKEGHPVRQVVQESAIVRLMVTTAVVSGRSSVQSPATGSPQHLSPECKP